jgi:hypothetical protein
MQKIWKNHFFCNFSNFWKKNENELKLLTDQICWLKKSWKNHRSTKLTNQNKKSTRKLCLAPQKWKGAKNLYGADPTEFAGLTQNIKKLSEFQIMDFYRKNLKKTIFRTSKVKRSQKFLRGYPTKFLGLTQNLKKKYRNTKSTYEYKKFPKKNYV